MAIEGPQIGAMLMIYRRIQQNGLILFQVHLYFSASGSVTMVVFAVLGVRWRHKRIQSVQTPVGKNAFHLSWS